ncbi:hypothetical protein ROHU_012667 [Labeo rohita]|uniref:Uncharacterized protein n=1 Tax=Labeo rohita TaxID=84645 RepID=A0A498LB55_LABRO|nr:hypothetical protein ROHU_012667 [Labeo rohita]
MHNSEVEYKKMKSKPLAARPASTAVLRGCVGGRLTVCQSIWPSVRSSPLARAVKGVKNDGKSAHYEPLCEKCSTYMRASTNAAGGKRRDAPRRRSHETSKFAALVPSLPMHRAESERAYILGPRRVRLERGTAEMRDRPVLHATQLQRQQSRISTDSMSSRY